MELCPKCNSLMVIAQGTMRCQNCGLQTKGVSRKEVNKVYVSAPAPGTVVHRVLEREENIEELKDAWNKTGYIGEKPIVSIVMPTYKRQHTIQASIGSILNQTYRAWELIVIDNELGSKYTFKDNRIRYYNHPEQRGAAYARNKGMTYAECELLSFFDDDDVMQPNYLEMMVTPFTRDPKVMMTICKIKLVEGLVTDHNNFCTPVCMVRRKLAQPTWGKSSAHDQIFFGDIAGAVPAESIIRIPDVLVHSYTSPRGGIREGDL